MKGALLFVASVVLLAGCSSKSSSSATEMPVIDDPALLTRECAGLEADTTVHTIAKEEWPYSVIKLNPTAVMRQENGIFITTSGDSSAGSRGYVLAVFKPGNDAHYTITDTPYSKIYRFDFKP